MSFPLSSAVMTLELRRTEVLTWELGGRLDVPQLKRSFELYLGRELLESPGKPPPPAASIAEGT